LTPRSPLRAGFTLLEVLVALGILVLIGAIAWEAMASGLMLREYMEGEDEVTRSARVALDRIEREIGLAFLTPNKNSVNTYQTVFVGKDDADTDQVWFATKSHRRRYADSRECDQAEITLWTEDDPDHRGREVLLHRESQRIDHEPDKDGAIQPLVRNITRFDLRYLDPTTNEWTDDWDTTGAEQPGRLPRVVEVVLTIMAPDPDEPGEEVPRSFVRTVFVETSPAIRKSALSGSGPDGPVGAKFR
jgi:prepilin-type N-terminal cleavage/methylation domain-containing protein